MVAKIEFQETFTTYVFRFFVRVWLQGLQKLLIWPKKFCFENIKRQKKQNSMLISNPLKKFQKMRQQSYMQTNLKNNDEDVETVNDVLSQASDEQRQVSARRKLHKNVLVIVIRISE